MIFPVALPKEVSEGCDSAEEGRGSRRFIAPAEKGEGVEKRRQLPPAGERGGGTMLTVFPLEEGLSTVGSRSSLYQQYREKGNAAALLPLWEKDARKKKGNERAVVHHSSCRRRAVGALCPTLGKEKITPREKRSVHVLLENGRRCRRYDTIKLKRDNFKRRYSRILTNSIPQREKKERPPRRSCIPKLEKWK